GVLPQPTRQLPNAAAPRSAVPVERRKGIDADLRLFAGEIRGRALFVHLYGAVGPDTQKALLRRLDLPVRRQPDGRPESVRVVIAGDGRRPEPEATAGTAGTALITADLVRAVQLGRAHAGSHVQDAAAPRVVPGDRTVRGAHHLAAVLRDRVTQEI